MTPPPSARSEPDRARLSRPAMAAPGGCAPGAGSGRCFAAARLPAASAQSAQRPATCWRRPADRRSQPEGAPSVPSRPRSRSGGVHPRGSARRRASARCWLREMPSRPKPRTALRARPARRPPPATAPRRMRARRGSKARPRSPRPPRVSPLPHRALIEAIASATTSAALAPVESGASSRRWARTGSASACTSSGRA